MKLITSLKHQSIIETTIAISREANITTTALCDSSDLVGQETLFTSSLYDSFIDPFIFISIKN